MHHPITSLKTYVLVWAALIVLTGTTWGVAYIDMGPFNIVVAITIAVVKMMLVAVIFMNARHLDHVSKLFAAAGLFWLLILLVFFLSDYLSRDWQPIGKMW
ncbi:MAG TPA: cytochrome C oxidase subunit IV family protein [Verrucomicrobiae bacterium]|nr:cytochrome C oxidase subunit IV family protein [Bryobacteraceae bacterium]HXU20340.1 cytochrome C oxidase subunit IV family protein [Verrucomicrobiae bacterium]